MTTELDAQVVADAPPAARRLPGSQRAAANQEPDRIPTPTYAPPADLSTDPDEAPEPTPVLDTTDWGRFAQPAPEAQAALPAARGFVEPLQKEPPATWGRRRRVLRVLSLGIAHPRPGEEELNYRSNQRLILGTKWSRSVRIAVANPKGGVGKTPTALNLGGMIAEQGRSVAIWDAADAANTLTARAENAPSRCVSRIEEAPGDYRVPGTIGGIAAKQSSFADVFGSLTDREFDGDSIERVTWALDRTYQVQVADTGNVQHSPAFRKVIELADMLVIPTIVTADSVAKATRLLERLQNEPGSYLLTAGAVIAVMRYGGPETPGLHAQLPDIFSGLGVGAVIEIPFDPAIARGTTINTRSLTRTSRLAWARLAAAAVTNINVK